MTPTTLCKNCTFEDTPGSCFVGRVDKLRNTPGVEITQDGPHNVIKGKICDWNYPRYFANPDLKELSGKIRQARMLNVPFIVVSSEDTSLAQITDSIHSLQNQQLKPQSIHLIDYTKIGLSLLMDLGKDSDVPLSVIKVADGDYAEKYIWQKTQKFDQTYYGVLRAGFWLPVNFLRKLDEEFNDNMNHFACMKVGNYCTVRSLLLSNEVGADYIQTPDGWLYEDKVLAWCARNDQEHLVQRWENLG